MIIALLPFQQPAGQTSFPCAGCWRHDAHFHFDGTVSVAGDGAGGLCHGAGDRADADCAGDGTLDASLFQEMSTELTMTDAVAAGAPAMPKFGPALLRLWLHGDSKIPGLRAAMIAQAPLMAYPPVF